MTFFSGSARGKEAGDGAAGKREGKGRPHVVRGGGKEGGAALGRKWVEEEREDGGAEEGREDGVIYEGRREGPERGREEAAHQYTQGCTW